jgi:hypothetical protein
MLAPERAQGADNALRSTAVLAHRRRLEYWHWPPSSVSSTGRIGSSSVLAVCSVYLLPAGARVDLGWDPSTVQIVI